MIPTSARVAALTLMLSFAKDSPDLRVYPRAVLVNQAVRLTCRVPRHADNRRVTWGLELVTSSSRDLEGENSPITFEALVEHVPCEPGAAFCEVIRVNRDQPLRAVATLAVGGCDE